jgi:hypothetical protein
LIYAKACAERKRRGPVLGRDGGRVTAGRAIAIAVPVRDEAEGLPGCLAALDVAAGLHDGPVVIFALVNGCIDGSVGVLRAARLRHATLAWRRVTLPPGRAHAGWARRLALDAAADLLAAEDDLLLSTDADTCVDPRWIAATVAHVEAGADAVAGRALTLRADRAALGVSAHRRLDMLTRYYVAIDWLRARAAPPADPWPRHYYEGGASMAMTLAAYRATGGAPTPPVGEDRALFAALARTGARVRHPIDVRVFTSCRTSGRAAGGMADTYARWIAQDEDAPIHGAFHLDAALGAAEPGDADRLSFAALPDALAEARRRIRACSAHPPQIESIPCPTVGAERLDRVAQQGGEPIHRLVAAERIVGFAGPVDEQHVAARRHRTG